MNKHNYLGLGLLSALCGFAAVGCEEGSSSSDMDASVPSASLTMTTSSVPTEAASTTASTPSAAEIPSAVASTSSPVAAGGMGGSGGAGGAGNGGGGSAGMGNTGGTCDVAGLSIFARSDSDQAWDDNDFDSVTVEGTCPVLVNATWPHEADWQNADPAEANHEEVHFTLDSYYSGDLTGKQLNLTIELADNQYGPTATAGGYRVSIVSVSSYTYDEIVEPAEPSLDAGMSGLGDAGGDAAVSDSGSADPLSSDGGVGSSDGGVTLADASADASVVDEGPMIITRTGYSEAESALDDRLILRRVGDRATLTFALPNKAAPDSYDPTTVIKINVRIYTMFSGEEPASDLTDAGAVDVDPLLDAGAAGDAGSDVMSSDVDDGLDAGMTTDGPADAATTAPVDTSVPETTPTQTAPARVYDYVSARFAITNFSVSDFTGL